MVQPHMERSKAIYSKSISIKNFLTNLEEVSDILKIKHKRAK